jgi:hypothetical protein
MNDNEPVAEALPVRRLRRPRPSFDDDEDGSVKWPVRILLIVIALGLVIIFTIACFLHPYNAEGQALTQETHRQMGLPPCTFYKVTGLPCPSCGFTTSFSLLMHGDPVNSLRANSVGTLLALFWLSLIPWSLISAFRGRYLFIRSLEKALMYCLIFFIIIMLARWGLVIGLS